MSARVLRWILRLAAIAVFLVLPANAWRQFKAIRQHDANRREAEAVIVNREMVKWLGAKGATRNRYFVEAEFRDEKAQTRQVRAEVSWEQYKKFVPGAPVFIVYRADEFHEGWVDSDAEFRAERMRDFEFTAMWIGIAAFAIVFVEWLYRYHRAFASEAIGVYGTVTKIEERTRKGGRKVWIVYYQFQDAKNKPREGYSEIGKFELAHADAAGKPTVVMYSQERPWRHTLLRGLWFVDPASLIP